MGYYRAQRSEVAVLRSSIAERKGMRVLEIGCGEGGIFENIQLVGSVPNVKYLNNLINLIGK